ETRRQLRRHHGDVGPGRTARLDLALDRAVASDGDAWAAVEAEEHGVRSHPCRDATRSPPPPKRADTPAQGDASEASGRGNAQHLSRAYLFAGPEPVGKTQRLHADAIAFGDPGQRLAALHSVGSR